MIVCSNCIARCWAGLGIVVIWKVEPAALSDSWLAGIAHDGGEFVEQGAKAVRGCAVFEFACGDFLERGLGALGGGDRIAVLLALESSSANINSRHASRMCHST